MAGLRTSEIEKVHSYLTTRLRRRWPAGTKIIAADATAMAAKVIASDATASHVR